MGTRMVSHQAFGNRTSEIKHHQSRPQGLLLDDFSICGDRGVFSCPPVISKSREDPGDIIISVIGLGCRGRCHNIHWFVHLTVFFLMNGIYWQYNPLIRVTRSL